MLFFFSECASGDYGYDCEHHFLADLFLYSYESEFAQKLVKGKKIHEARAFNFTYRYYLFEFCLKNIWNCSLTQQILSHSFYD
jgi:hypothetical protein